MNVSYRCVPAGLLVIFCGWLLEAAPGSNEFSGIDPTTAGWSTAALDELAGYVQSQKTTGFLIVQNRRAIYEHNWPYHPTPGPSRRTSLTGRMPAARSRKMLPPRKRVS